MPLAFLAAIAVSTILLMLPVSRRGPGEASFLVALFTATSAICVTGLTVVDTPTYWSETGLVLITLMVEVGGFGIVAGATLLGVLVSQRLGLRSRLIAQAETTGLAIGDVRRVLRQIALTLLGLQLAVAVLLTSRFWLGYDYPFGRAVWHGVFHGVQAVNNAGFALYSNSFIGFASDGWILIPVALGTIGGALGFPALFELARQWRQPGRWSTHARLTIWGSLVLLVAGFASMLILEWHDPDTLGPLSVPQKALAAFFLDAATRSSGFNEIPLENLPDENLAITIALMFIGGGSASTTGGIKVSTFFLLAFVVWAELRGEPDVVIGRRRVSEASQRQAITVALLSIALLTVSALIIIGLTSGLPFTHALFEVTSAFGTVGLSLGVTPNLPPAGQVVLIVLMFIGRVGPAVVGSALALNTQHRLYRYPEERAIVG